MNIITKKKINIKKTRLEVIRPLLLYKKDEVYIIKNGKYQKVGETFSPLF